MEGKLFCSSSVVHDGNNGWIGKVQARSRAGDGQTLPFWGSALWDLLKRLGMLAGSQTALPTLMVPLVSKLTKGERLQHKMGQKCLALPAQGMERQGGREEKHLFPRFSGMAWANLALVSNVFPLTAPGTVNLSCYLPLSRKHRQVQHCNSCLNSMLSFCRTLFALKWTTGLWSSELQDDIENLKQRRQRNAYTDLIFPLILPNLYTHYMDCTRWLGCKVIN